MAETFKSYIKDIIIVVVVVLAITFFIKPIVVKGVSMQPTLHENNYLFVSRQAYRFGEPQRGDIVVFPHDDGDRKELYIKRIVGIPGDKITIEDGDVYINDEEVDQSFTKDGSTPGDIKDLTVPKGQIFVMGDNRNNSSDSRYFGCVEIEDVTGKAFLRLFPFSEIDFL